MNLGTCLRIATSASRSLGNAERTESRERNLITSLDHLNDRINESFNSFCCCGIEGFYKTRKTRIGGSVLTPIKLAKAQQLLCEHMDRHEIAKELDVPYDTLRKAISCGRLEVPSKPYELQEIEIEIATSKSERDQVDYQAAEGMGTACVRVEERAGAAFGVCDGAVTRFEPCLDVPNGGALVALPALLANGLMEGSEKMLGGVNGYYKCLHVLLMLAFMGLCRIKSVEKLRGHAPGEFGKMLGLDRAPEARCMRNKMDELSAGEAAEKWALHLSKFWMDANPAAAGVLYIDGHVQVYHGGLTKLPRQFVSREKLCLRGIDSGELIPMFSWRSEIASSSSSFSLVSPTFALPHQPA